MSPSNSFCIEFEKKKSRISLDIVGRVKSKLPLKKIYLAYYLQAYKALDQFHSVDRIHRKQHFYLNFLESCHSPKGCNAFAPSPLQAVSQSNCLELIMHPIFQRLIDVKWRYFRAEAWLDILPNVLMAILYTILACSVPQNVDNFYIPLSKNWWKIVIAIVFLAITLNEIRKEGKEYYRSKKQSKKLMKWRRKEVERDFAFCHPRWPQERNFVEQELKRIKQDKGNNYFSDAWNFVDIITYAMLVVVTILHMSSVLVENNLYHDVFIRILSCSVIPVWVRLLKYARPFPNQGPFVVMLDHIVKDSAKWLLVIMMIYIPYGAAFWIMYGQNSQTPVKGYNDTTSLIFTMLRMPLLDDYNFAQLEKAAPYMARVLCGSFIIISAIVLMNLYIALLSNTFQRVYDNARATAAIQRVRLLQDLELDTSENKLKRYREYIRENYSPEENDYIAFFSEEEEQSRRQDEKVSEIHNIVSKRFGGKKFGKLERSEFDSVLDDLDMLKRSHSEIRRSLSLLTSNLEELTRSNALIVDERNRIDRFQEQEHVLKRLDCTVARIEAVYDIDNGRNPGKPQRYHKANQTEWYFRWQHRPCSDNLIKVKKESLFLFWYLTQTNELCTSVYWKVLSKIFTCENYIRKYIYLYVFAEKLAQILFYAILIIMLPLLIFSVGQTCLVYYCTIYGL